MPIGASAFGLRGALDAGIFLSRAEMGGVKQCVDVLLKRAVIALAVKMAGVLASVFDVLQRTEVPSDLIVKFVREGSLLMHVFGAAEEFRVQCAARYRQVLHSVKVAFLIAIGNGVHRLARGSQVPANVDGVAAAETLARNGELDPREMALEFRADIFRAQRVGTAPGVCSLLKPRVLFEERLRLPFTFFVVRLLLRGANAQSEPFFIAHVCLTAFANDGAAVAAAEIAEAARPVFGSGCPARAGAALELHPDGVAIGAGAARHDGGIGFHIKWNRETFSEHSDSEFSERNLGDQTPGFSSERFQQTAGTAPEMHST